MKNKSVDEFLLLFISKSTKATYRCAINNLFKFLNESPDSYFNNNRDYSTDIEKYVLMLSEKNSPPLTIRTYLAAMKGFFYENDIELSQRFWRKINGRIKGKKARTLDEVPSGTSTLKRLFTYMDVKGKALFVTLASSGMRVGETLKIRLSDIDFDKEPPQIYVRGEYTKSGDSRICFISSEAKEILLEWLSQRKNWLESSITKGHGLGIEKNIDDDRVFPFTSNIALVMWNNALKKANLVKFDPSTKRRTLHPHILRKWFRTRLGKINVDYTETIMGHSGYLTDAYRRYGVEEIVKWYLENQQNLYIFTDASEIARLKMDVQKDIEAQRKIIEDLVLEKSSLKTQMNELSTRIIYKEIYVYFP